MKTHRLAPCALGLLMLALSGCGGGPQTAGIEGSGIDNSGTKAPAITSSGAVTALGSIFVNGVEYDLTHAVISIDGIPATEADLDVGSVVIVEGELNANGTTGTAYRVTAGIALAGPIAQIDPVLNRLTVLGQTVEIDATTVIENRIDGVALGGLVVGDDIEITGFADSTGVWTARRIAARSSGNALQITGRVANVDTANHRVTIGAQLVDYGSATLVGVDAQSLAGAPIRVTADQVDSNGVLLAREVALRDLRLPGSVGDLAALQGWVTRFASETDFDVDGHPVVTTASTAILGQEAALGKVRLDSFVSVQGTLIQGGVVQATSVRTNTLISLDSVIWSIDNEFVRGDLTDFYGYGCHVEPDTVFTVDGFPGPIDRVAPGDIATIYEHHPLDGTPAQCQIVAVEHTVRGPIESKPMDSASMTVMGQRIWLDTSRSTNRLFGIDGFGTLDTLNVGDIVEVSGYLTANGDILAKSLHAAGTNDRPRVIGFSRAVDTTLKRFKLGDLTIDYAGAEVAGFASGAPVEGDRVLVTSDFAPNAGTLRATAVRYEARVPRGATSNLLKLNGLVTRFVSPDDFDVEGRRTVPLASELNVDPATTWVQRCDMTKVRADMRFERLVTIGNGVDQPPIYFRPICMPGRQLDERNAVGQTDFYEWVALTVSGPVEAIDLGNRAVRVAGVTLMLHPGTLLARFDAPPADSTAYATSAPISLEDLVVGDRVLAKADGFPNAAGIRPMTSVWLGDAVPMPPEEVSIATRITDATEPELLLESGIPVRVPATATFEGEGCYTTYTYEANEFWTTIAKSISEVTVYGSMSAGELVPSRISFSDPTETLPCY